MGNWISKGDRVVVIAGNDKGKVGNVLSCDKKRERLIVQGVNIRKKHMKRTQESQGAQIIEIERSIHLSNVSLCDEEGKPLRIRVKEESGEKVLYYHKGDKEVVLRKFKKMGE